MIKSKCIISPQEKVIFLKSLSPMPFVFTFHLDIMTLKPLYFDPQSTLLKLESVSVHPGMFYFSL